MLSFKMGCPARASTVDGDELWARLGDMRVQVNGEPRELAHGSTIVSLLTTLGLAGRPVAVERNTAIVPRAQHGSTQLEEGDTLEVVQFVGGG